jgi:hypothetical protein
LYCRQEAKVEDGVWQLKGENHNRSHFCSHNPSCHELPDDEIGVSADSRSFKYCQSEYRP